MPNRFFRVRYKQFVITARASHPSHGRNPIADVVGGDWIRVLPSKLSDKLRGPTARKVSINARHGGKRPPKKVTLRNVPIICTLQVRNEMREVMPLRDLDFCEVCKRRFKVDQSLETIPLGDGTEEGERVYVYVHVKCAVPHRELSESWRAAH